MMDWNERIPRECSQHRFVILQRLDGPEQPDAVAITRAESLWHAAWQRTRRTLLRRMRRVLGLA